MILPSGVTAAVLRCMETVQMERTALLRAGPRAPQLCKTGLLIHRAGTQACQEPGPAGGICFLNESVCHEHLHCCLCIQTREVVLITRARLCTCSLRGF